MFYFELYGTFYFQKKDTSIIEITILEHNERLTDSVIVENFNTHFTSFSPVQNVDWQFLESNVALCSSTLFLRPVSDLDVVDIINSLKASNACGFDGISNNLLKECKYALTNVLTVLINLSMEKGIFPEKLKMATVIPLFKKGDPNDYSNYRAYLPASPKYLKPILKISLYLS